MTRQEAFTIVGMVLNHWQVRSWSGDEIEAYATSIMDLGAEVTTSAVIRASRELKFPPKPAELREYVRDERKRLAPVVVPVEAVAKPMPDWVRRWVCARMLYDYFGKGQDMRRFPEQGDFGDLTRELMPEGAWVDEANSLSENELLDAFRGKRRPSLPRPAARGADDRSSTGQSAGIATTTNDS